MLKKYFFIVIVSTAAILIIPAALYFKFLLSPLKESAHIQKQVTEVKKEMGLESIPAGKTLSLKELGINLKVLGILLGDKPEEHLAVIKDAQTRQQGFYYIGNNIGCFRVKAIYFGQVVLEKEDTREELILTVEGNVGNSTETNEKLTECISPTECFVQREGLKKRMENINEVLGQVKVLPAIEKGRLKGFRLQDLAKEGIAEELGLKKGDIVRAVNEEPLDGLDKPFVIYSKYRNSPVVQVDIERQGKNISLIYRFR